MERGAGDMNNPGRQQFQPSIYWNKVMIATWLIAVGIVGLTVAA